MLLGRQEEEGEGVLGRQVMQDVTSHCDVSRRSPWKIPSARESEMIQQEMYFIFSAQTLARMIWQKIDEIPG